MKYVKVTVLCCVLVASMVMIKIKANSACYEVEAKTSTQMSTISFQSDERYPQTIVHDVVLKYLDDADITKNKKVLVLGYDGFREDALGNVLDQEDGAISSIVKDGGLYHSYAGANGMQETSTAPGWLSILSGQWAHEIGVRNNSDQKPLEVSTFLDERIDQYSSTFIASWAPHFDVTYQEDVQNQSGKAVYQQMGSDDETLATLQRELANPTSYDILFATLEYSDHAGHTSGYGNHIPAYVEAAQEVDRNSYALLQTINGRESYQDEDWFIIITSDHGGVNLNHGGYSDEEVNTWFAVNKDISKYL